MGGTVSVLETAKSNGGTLVGRTKRKWSRSEDSMGNSENGNPAQVVTEMAKLVGGMQTRDNVTNWALLHRSWTAPHTTQLDVNWLPPVTQAHKR